MIAGRGPTSAVSVLQKSRRLVEVLHAQLQSNRNYQNFICNGSGRDAHNGGVWKECKCTRERRPLRQYKYLSESFEGEIALYRGRRKRL